MNQQNFLQGVPLPRVPASNRSTRTRTKKKHRKKMSSSSPIHNSENPSPAVTMEIVAPAALDGDSPITAQRVHDKRSVDPGSISVTLEDVSPTSRKQPRLQADLMVLHTGTPMQAVFSRFVFIQVVFNMIASAGFPTLCFWFLFAYLGEGPYEWWEGPCAGVVVGSCITSPILVLCLAPAGMPEAIEKGWFVQAGELPHIQWHNPRKLLDSLT